MKKLKLLFATLALLVGTSATWAQDAGTYYIQNVSNGKWLAPGNNWSTQASVLNHADYWKLAKISDGVFTLESVVSNGGTSYYLNGTYCDGVATNFTFTAVAGKDNTYTIANGEGGLLTTNGTTVDVSGTDASAVASQWKLWSESDMAAGMAAATVENPFDATYLIKDHDLGRNNRDYSAWSNTGATDPKSSTADGGATVYSIEAYHTTFDVNQTLSNVSNGVYAVRVNGFYRQDGSSSLPYVYANDSKTTLPVRTGTENNMQDAAVSFVAGNYLSEPAYVQVTDGTLKIGVATEGNSCWTIFKSFHLAYYGDCTVAEVVLAEYVKAYNDALTEAQAFTQTSMFAEAWNDLQDAISNNTLDLSNVTQEQLETAAANLTAANAAARVAVKRRTVYDGAVNLINGGTNVDLTSVVENASFEDGNLNGWTTVDGGAPANNNNWGKVDTWYVERWTWNTDTEQRHLSDGTLTHDALVLPAGLYTITAKAQNQEQKNGVAGTGYFLYANDEKVEITGTNTYSTTVLLSNDKSELVIKFALENCTGNWISCDDIHLTYVGEDFPAYSLVTGKMNADVAADQTAAEEAFLANKNITNYNALTAAITAAQASKGAYEKATTAIANANALKEAHNLASATAYTTFAEAIAALETKYNENTMTTNEGNGAGLSLGTVITDWRAAANSAAVAYLNDGFSLNAFDAALYINTWSNEGEGDGSNFKVPFYEYFAGEGSALSAKTWTGQVSGLENGLYSVSAWVRVRSKNSETAAADLTGITMNVNGGTDVDVTEGDVVPVQEGNARFQHKVYTAQGIVRDGTLKVNFVIDGGNNIHWLSFKNIKYTKERDLTLEEENAFLQNAITAATAATGTKSELMTTIAKTANPSAADVTYQNVVAGSEGKAMADALDAAAGISANSSVEDIEAATDALTSATATYLAAAPSYERALMVIAIAQQMNTISGAGSQTTAQLVSDLQTLMTNTSTTAATIEATANQGLTALMTASVTYTATKLGFEKDQYAPYNNVEGLELAATATTMGTTPANYTNAEFWLQFAAMLAYQWAENTEDVDAIYDGDFANATIQATNDDVVLAGWTMKNNGHTRQTFKGNGENGKACLGENEVGLFVYPGTYNYGEIVGYTMPLKANVVYVAEAKYCSWAGDSNNDFGLTIAKGETTIATKSFGANKTACTEANAFKSVKLYFTADEDADYTLSVNVNGNTFMTGFHITKAVVDEITIDEDVDYTPTASDYANVTLNRTIKAKGDDGIWNTICLPFDLTADQTIAAFGDDTEIATYSEELDTKDNDGNSKVEFTIAESKAITANTPVLLRTSTAGTSYTFNGVTIKAGDGDAMVAGAANFDFVGTYDALTTIAKGDYFISSNILYMSKGATTIKGTRAYIKAKEKGGEARIANFFVDGVNTTNIEGLVIEGAGAGKIYNLNGQEVKTPKKGLYIQNGKKISVK